MRTAEAAAPATADAESVVNRRRRRPEHTALSLRLVLLARVRAGFAEGAFGVLFESDEPVLVVAADADQRLAECLGVRGRVDRADPLPRAFDFDMKLICPHHNLTA